MEQRYRVAEGEAEVERMSVKRRQTKMEAEKERAEENEKRVWREKEGRNSFICRSDAAKRLLAM